MNIIQEKLPSYTDERGIIETLVESENGSLLKITTNPGYSRAVHWHQKDWHYCTVDEGQIVYFERPVGSKEKPTLTIIHKGQTFFTDSMMEHEMFFPCHSVFHCFSKLSRAQKNYEEDTIRLPQKLSDIYYNFDNPNFTQK